MLQDFEITDNIVCIGDVSSIFIRDFLSTGKIPLMISDLGDNTGRVIYLCPDDFSVYVEKTKRTVNKILAQREKQFWQKSMEAHEKKVAEPDILVWND